MKLAIFQGCISALLGAIGFQLKPDASIYASGALLPNSLLAGLAGRLGGMALLIAISAISSGLAVYLLPTRRERLLFMALSFPWLLYTGADAVGLVAVALLYHHRTMRYWFLTGFAHAAAAVVTLPLALGWRRSATWAFVLAGSLGFLFVSMDTQTDVAMWEHSLYISRYLLPATWIMLASSRGRAYDVR